MTQKVALVTGSFAMPYNKAKQHRSLRSLNSLALAPFVHGFAIIAQIHNHKSAVVGGVMHFKETHGIKNGL